MNRPGERIVTLVDGSQVSNYSEDWRHECEARAVLAMPTLRQRRAYLYGETESVRINGKWVTKLSTRGIQQVRGMGEVKRLEATMTTIWRMKRASNDNHQDHAETITADGRV